MMRYREYDGEILDDFTEFEAQDTVVWIDPLDGTRDFTLGNLSAVTVLIGLAVKGVPKIGVVHHPFTTNEQLSPGLTFFAT